MILLIGALAAVSLQGGRAAADPRPPDGDLGFPCNFLGACPERVAPGVPRRDVRPFAAAGREGSGRDGSGRDSLGQPCGWRERLTPEGPRRVRACW